MNPLTARHWSPYVVGAGLGVLSWFAFATADHPLGVSTAFEYTSALVLRAVAPAWAAGNSYFQEESPQIDWEWMLVLGVFLGAVLSAWMSGDRERYWVPPQWAARFGTSRGQRILVATLGGAVMLFGARLAGGCTSGHGISGNLQLAVSSIVFSASFVVAGVITAFALYGKEGWHHV
jgi:hypothetical protein